MSKTIEERLTGGHPNSLGETVPVAEDVLKDSSKQLFYELCNTYNSEDEVVRLRVSSALKRVCGLHRNSVSASVQPKPEWIIDRFDWLINDIGWSLDQPSAKWTIAQIIQELQNKISEEQRHEAIKLLKNNLETESDWIVLNTTADTLADFAVNDVSIKKWLVTELKRMKTDKRKSVSSKATKLLKKLDG
jgi:hypothetical protein